MVLYQIMLHNLCWQWLFRVMALLNELEYNGWFLYIRKRFFLRFLFTWHVSAHSSAVIRMSHDVGVWLVLSADVYWRRDPPVRLDRWVTSPTVRAPFTGCCSTHTKRSNELQSVTMDLLIIFRCYDEWLLCVFLCISISLCSKYWSPALL